MRYLIHIGIGLCLRLGKQVTQFITHYKDNGFGCLIGLKVQVLVLDMGLDLMQ